MPWGDWVRKVEVEPSLYAADFARLGEQVASLLNAGARIFHFDVGDGHFVEPVTIGPVVLRSIAGLVHAREGILDCHLMVDNPERHIPQFAQAGADSVTVHYEVCEDPGRIAALAGEHGLAAGLAFNPDTEVGDAAAAADGFEIVTCMSVHPGYSGQAFIPESLERVRTLRGLLGDDVHVQVDGGVGPDNVEGLVEAGATLLVAASAIFGREDLPRAYLRLTRAFA
jgi:ribulose-phosphate 3-epimerase